MEPKLDSIVYIVLFLIPGFIFYKVAARYIVHEKYDGSEKLISIIAASSILHAVAIPLFVRFVDAGIQWQLGVGLALGLLGWPTVAGLVFGLLSGGRVGERIRRFVQANPREPTAWGYFWAQRKPVIVRAFLDDGTAVMGAFSQNSSASIPNTDDLYLEKQYLLDDEKRPTGLAPGTMGCWIPAARLRLVEFYDMQPKEDADGQRKACNGNGASANGGQRRSPGEEDGGDSAKTVNSTCK